MTMLVDKENTIGFEEGALFYIDIVPKLFAYYNSNVLNIRKCRIKSLMTNKAVQALSLCANGVKRSF